VSTPGHLVSMFEAGSTGCAVHTDDDKIIA
jgi:hypothetical protein